MTLKDLIQQIEFKTQKETRELKKKKESELKKIDQEFEQKLKEIKEKTEKTIAQEKERLLERYCQEKEFVLKMQELAFKEKGLKECFGQLKEDIKGMRAEKKLSVLKKEVEKIRDFIDEKTIVFTPLGKKQEIENFLKEIGISKIKVEEKDLKLKDGFLIESEDFEAEISLPSLIKELFEKEKINLSKILFGLKS